MDMEKDDDDDDDDDDFHTWDGAPQVHCKCHGSTFSTL
jgi:Rieske Fe-S protein